MSDGRNKGEAYTHEYFEGVGVAVGQLSRVMEGYRELSVFIRGFSCRGPAVEGGDFLLTVRGENAEGLPVVAFISGSTVPELFRSLEGRLAAGQVQWKPDKFAR